MTDHKERDELSGVETTGHEWDGLKELNNPAPRWWLWVFLLCVLWSIGYWVVYPAWPTLSGHTKGNAGWTQYKKLAAEQHEIVQRRGVFEEKIKTHTLEEIASDPELYQFAIAGGRTMFMENCASCHGTGGQGGNGYPNLNDDDWIWGGDLASIYSTIQNGVRSGHEDAKGVPMPAFGRDKMLGAAQIDAVAKHVLSLSGKGEANEEGAAIYAQQCASCHGADGAGSHEFGAPNLKDAIWFYGSGSLHDVKSQVHNPRMGVMPTWKERLGDATIKQLTIYVHELGGGEPTKPVSNE